MRTTWHSAGMEPFPKLLVAMDNCDGHTVVNLALKLMALAFVRTQELLRAPWSEFDLEKGLWKFDAKRMKKDRPQISYIPPRATYSP